MKTWAMIIIGAANIAFCVLGLVYFAWILSLHWNHWPGSPSAKEWAEFFAILFVALFLIGYSAYLGVRLIRKDTSAIPRVNLIFLIEILYLLLFIGPSWLLAPDNHARMQIIVVAFWGIAEAPLAPQLALYYPFIGLLFMLVFQLYDKRKSGEDRSVFNPKRGSL